MLFIFNELFYIKLTLKNETKGLKLNEAQIAELEQEFMETFETFTVILSLSKK